MSVSGTLTGQRQVEKLVEVDGFDIEVTLSDHMAVFRYDDRPGIVGTVGRILGEAGVNIAGMQVSRDRKGGHALVAMTVDGAIPTRVLDEIVAEIGAATARQVDLTETDRPGSVLAVDAPSHHPERRAKRRDTARVAATYRRNDHDGRLLVLRCRGGAR